jgi:hypothetical protein
LENLKPVEEFPHTPLIPISESAMKRYQEAIERRKMSPFTFGLNKDKLWGGFLFLIAFSIVMLLVRLLLKVEENMLYEYEQMKIRRYGHAPRTIEEDKLKDRMGKSYKKAEP